MQSKHNKELVPFARQLRKEMTKEERHLWYDFLRDYPIRFKRQKVFGKYIVDFYCATAKLAVELGVDGHRADITVIKTALTMAAFSEHKEVEMSDLKAAAKLVLPHRMRRRPFEEGQLDWNKVEAFLGQEA